MMQLFIKKYSRITSHTAVVNGEALPIADFEQGKFLSALYRLLKIDYPKFFKMDNLSKLGFVASELIFGDDKQRFEPREDIAVICFNRSASLDADRAYEATIQHDDAYFPSPSLFVYTLPNIVTGEIAIRNKFFGETSFYVSEKLDAQQIFNTVCNAFADKKIRSVLAAWLEYCGDTCEALMMLVEVEGSKVFSVKEISKIYET